MPKTRGRSATKTRAKLLRGPSSSKFQGTLKDFDDHFVGGDIQIAAAGTGESQTVGETTQKRSVVHMMGSKTRGPIFIEDTQANMQRTPTELRDALLRKWLRGGLVEETWTTLPTGASISSHMSIAS